jgi:hypothetical protein
VQVKGGFAGEQQGIFACGLHFAHIEAVKTKDALRALFGQEGVYIAAPAKDDWFAG